jgi:hypothetical protein
MLWAVLAMILAAALAVALAETLRGSGPPLWATTLGLAAFGALALASWQGWNIHPDWAFHWGPKAQRFALAQGIDLHYLTRPFYAYIHPDYPTLIPNLTASLALALGIPVTPRVGAVVTLLFAAVWLFALRALAVRLRPERARRSWVFEAAWPAAAWCVTMFATGFRQAAGADLPFACAVTLGALALATPREELRRGPVSADLAVGVAAALASQIKFEGSVFALVLVVLWLVQRAVTRGARPTLAAPALATTTLAAPALAVLPPLTTVGAWILWNRHYGLFLNGNIGALDLGRLPAVADGLLDAAAVSAWHGVPFLVVALPWLCLRRQTRWPALLLAGQLATYLGVYLSTPLDLGLLIHTSGPRLLFHLVPTFLVLLVVALAPQASSDSGSKPTASSDDPVSPTFLA